MTNVYGRVFGSPSPQSEQNRADQVRNNAGGYVYSVSDEKRFERFLILGTEGGTYYIDERRHTLDNTMFAQSFIKSNPVNALAMIVDISTTARAFRNSHAIFALALFSRFAPDQYKVQVRTALPKVCRTATHLYEFATYVEQLGGWSMGRRKAVADWFTNKTPGNLAYQAVKYRQRGGWSMRDLFRLSHPKGVHPVVGGFILGKEYEADPSIPGLEILSGFKAVQALTDVKKVPSNLDVWPELPWEAIPTQFLRDTDVWKKLFYNGQLKGQAQVRNITRLARIGAFNDLRFAVDYAEKLQDENNIKGGKMHPMNYLMALFVHLNGQSDRNNPWQRNKDWNTVPQISSALDAAFHKSFKFVEPSNKRLFLALDVSGSMSSKALGTELSCAQVSAAMAMTVARTEKYHMIRGFSGGFYGRRQSTSDVENLKDLGINAYMDMQHVMRIVQSQTFGNTDCALPMRYATKHNLEIDAFVVFTDNETWAGPIDADQALRDYRRKTGINAKLIVVGMTATEFTIGDPNDPGILNVTGADANLPKLITEFAADRI